MKCTHHSPFYLFIEKKVSQHFLNQFKKTPTFALYASSWLKTKKLKQWSFVQSTKSLHPLAVYRHPLQPLTGTFFVIFSEIFNLVLCTSAATFKTTYGLFAFLSNGGVCSLYKLEDAFFIKKVRSFLTCNTLSHL